MTASAWPLRALGAVLAAAGCAGDPADSVGRLPTSYAECLARGGEAVRRSDVARCIFYTSPGRDRSAYHHCREGGGVQGVAGTGRGRAVAGQSHVCSLVFEEPQQKE